MNAFDRFLMSYWFPLVAVVVIAIAVIVVIVLVINYYNSDDYTIEIEQGISTTGNKVVVKYIDETVIRCHTSLGKGVWYDRVGFDGYYFAELTPEEYQEWCVGNIRIGVE